MKKIYLIIIIFCAFSISTTAQVIHVPGDQSNIQSGINIASDGDTVLVADGTYFENINFKGKAITVASYFIMDGDENHINNTIIDGSQPSHPDSAAVIMFCQAEDTTSVLFGFTITGGEGLWVVAKQARCGGGIALWDAGAKIQNNIIKNNEITDPSYVCGGGIGTLVETGNYWIVINNNIISNNVITTGGFIAVGGGINVVINATINNNIIEQNSCSNTGSSLAIGGGLVIEETNGYPNTVSMYNNKIIYNNVEGKDARGGGMAINQTSTNITSNKFGDNSIQGEEYAIGGGLYFDMPGQSDLHNNEITNNTCSSVSLAYGGGLYIFSNSMEFNMTDNLVQGNVCSEERGYGAGAFFYNSSGELNILNNLFDQNTCNANYGSTSAAVGINSPLAPVFMIGNTYSENLASGSQFSFGAVSIYEAEDVFVVADRNVFKNNSAKNGGGIFSMNTYNITISNNVFSANSVDRRGGAIFWNQYYGRDELYDENPPFGCISNKKTTGEFRPLIINNTVTGNYAEESGGGFYTTSNYDSLCPVFINNIFWNNTSGLLGKDIRHGGDEPIYVGYCNIDIDSIQGSWYGDENINVNPGFVASDTLYHLTDTSLCINTGIESIELDGMIYNCPPYDYEGDERPDPVYLLVDIGADEFYAIPEPPIAKDPTDIGTDYFIARWDESLWAEGYYLDVALDDTFNIYLPGYANLDVGDDTTHLVENLESVPYHYRVRAYNSAGVSDNSDTIHVFSVEVKELRAAGSKLHVYPNPSLGISHVTYHISHITYVLLEVIDIHGQKIKTLVNQKQSVGDYVVRFDGKGLPAGIYFVRLKIRQEVETKKLVLINNY